MKKKFCCLLLIFLALATVISTIPVGADEGTKGQSNRYNVVFVTDASGSMEDTDPDAYRFESIELFISLLANGGNKVGSVVFSTGVLSTHDLVEVNGRTEKSSIIQQVRSHPAKGWTDTGEALLTAVNMLKKGADPSLPSIIILLTDGRIEMGDDKKTAASVAKKEDALEEARGQGYQIYTISLNKDQSANSEEMKQIALATGGQFQEVKDASDLQSVFDIYYQMLYSTQSIKLVDETVPANGSISSDFNVADLGVEEVNVVVFGEVGNCKLRRPDGTEVSETEMKDILYKAKTFTLIKIPDPDYGVWKLTAEATPGSTIKIFKIYNPNLQIETSIENVQDSYVLNEDIKFITKIKEKDTVITDTTRYNGYKATLEIADYKGDVLHSQEITTAGQKGFEHTFAPTEYGTYYAKVLVETDELFSESETFILNVGNTPPTVTNKVVEWHINRWPFLFKTNSTLDLFGNAVDAEDADLKYNVKSSSWLEGDYSLEGSNLTIDKFSVSKGSFTIEAYDSLGAYCTFEVKVTSTNIGLWVVILILVAGLLVLGVIGIVTYRSLGIPFMGSFTVENIATGQSATTQKSRGRLRLSSMQIGQTGLGKNVYFQATGKSFVYLKSSKPVYADTAFKKTKKVKIDTSMDVRISMNPEFSDGIIVRFESMLNNNNLFF